MIPIKDNIPSRTLPVVNYAIIALTTLVFLIQWLGPERKGALIERLGMIPARISNPNEPVYVPDQRIVRTPYGYQRERFEREAAPPLVPAWLTLFTCIFLHGGWMHFLGNMWFLFIFGDNVEDQFGHGKYLIFYLIAGMTAGLAHLIVNWSSGVPTIGASGAIAGVMGSYILLYPHARVITVIPIFFILEIIVLPAAIFLGIWFFIQFFQGAFAIGSVQSTGVAWWAHIGGFVFGFLIVWILKRMGRLRSPVEARRPGTDRFRHYHRPWSRGGWL